MRFLADIVADYTGHPVERQVMNASSPFYRITVPGFISLLTLRPEDKRVSDEGSEIKYTESVGTVWDGRLAG